MPQPSLGFPCPPSAVQTGCLHRVDYVGYAGRCALLCGGWPSVDMLRAALCCSLFQTLRGYLTSIEEGTMPALDERRYRELCEKQRRDAKTNSVQANLQVILLVRTNRKVLCFSFYILSNATKYFSDDTRK